jgi:hypothetical protein
MAEGVKYVTQAMQILGSFNWPFGFALMDYTAFPKKASADSGCLNIPALLHSWALKALMTRQILRNKPGIALRTSLARLPSPIRNLTPRCPTSTTGARKFAHRQARLYPF